MPGAKKITAARVNKSRRKKKLPVANDSSQEPPKKKLKVNAGFAVQPKLFTAVMSVKKKFVQTEVNVVGVISHLWMAKNPKTNLNIMNMIINDFSGSMQVSCFHQAEVQQEKIVVGEFVELQFSTVNIRKMKEAFNYGQNINGVVDPEIIILSDEDVEELADYHKPTNIQLINIEDFDFNVGQMVNLLVRVVNRVEKSWNNARGSGKFMLLDLQQAQDVASYPLPRVNSVVDVPDHGIICILNAVIEEKNGYVNIKRGYIAAQVFTEQWLTEALQALLQVEVEAPIEFIELDYMYMREPNELQTLRRQVSSTGTALLPRFKKIYFQLQFQEVSNPDNFYYVSRRNAYCVIAVNKKIV